MTEGQSPSLFRENALKRVTTPEQLDQMIGITDPMGWISLLAIGLIIVAGLGWALFGSIDITVKGSGLLLSRGGVAALAAPTSGVCTGLKVRTGAPVRQGDVIGTIMQPEIAIDLKVARDDHDRARRKYEEALSTEEKERVRLRLEANSEKREALRSLIGNTREGLRDARVNVEAYELLYREKLVAYETLMQRRREVPAMEDRIKESEAALKALDAEDADILRTQSEKLRTLHNQMLEAAGRLEQLSERMSLGTRVVSNFDGRVLEVLAQEGSPVQAGAALATVEISGSGTPLEILMIVPARDGIRVKPGMNAHISPEFARKEEYGYVLGRVTSVGAFPVTRDRINKVLRNDQLTDSFAGGEAGFEVHVEPIADDSTKSGYKWSSSKGYPDPLPSGTIVKAEIVVERRPPITLLIPYLRHLLGA